MLTEHLTIPEVDGLLINRPERIAALRDAELDELWAQRYGLCRMYKAAAGRSRRRATYCGEPQAGKDQSDA